MNKYYKYIGALILTIVLVLLGFTAGFNYKKMQLNDAKKTGKEFTKSIFAGDYTKAYELGSKNFKKSVSQDEFKKSFENAKTNSPVYRQEAIVDSSKVVTIGYILDGLPKNENGSTKGLFTLTLVNESGKWRVESAILN